MGRRIYVETRVRAPMPELWAATQEPSRHQRWDLRFQRIDYLPRPDVGMPQRFRYATAGVSGTGISTGERHRPDGSATSSLRFASPSPLSPIAEGAGYWRYVPIEDGAVRFLTGYDYRPRYRTLDRVFRPLMGWATAWSFDRLRLWLEDGVTPGAGLARGVGAALWRSALVAGALTWYPVASLPALAVAWLTPPHRLTPSARRCLRRPPDRTAATAPEALSTLEKA